jgi:hypothetical protein
MVPSVWVDFETALLHIAGIDYTETDLAGNLVTRWRFEGHASFTVVALSNNERDLIYDQLVSLVAFSAQSEEPGPFRQAVEQGSLIAAQWSFDTVEARGQGAAPGTPWGTDEVVYEQGMAIQVVGEFVSSPVTRALVDLREIRVLAQPLIPGSGPYDEIDVAAASASVSPAAGGGPLG